MKQTEEVPQQPSSANNNETGFSCVAGWRALMIPIIII